MRYILVLDAKTDRYMFPHSNKDTGTFVCRPLTLFPIPNIVDTPTARIMFSCTSIEKRWYLLLAISMQYPNSRVWSLFMNLSNIGQQGKKYSDGFQNELL